MQPRVIFITIVAALLFAVAVTAAIHPTAHLSDADYAEYSMHIFKENHQARIEESKMKSGSGGDGLDISSLHSEMTQSCMVGKGYQFMIPRAYQSSGHVDPNVLANLRNAHTVGFKYVDVYFFPCPKCSKSPAAQVAEFAQGLAGAKFGMVWLDIEGSSYWTTPAANRSFVEEILKAFKAHGYVVGLYVNHTQWVEIFGADYKGCGGFPTWVAKYSTPVSKDCSTLSPFGPYATKDFNLRQYTGTTALCGGSVDQSAYC